MRENREVGEVLHISKSGRMIIKCSNSRGVEGLSRGTILVDYKARSVAKVIELIGPVESPYISALPLTDRVKKYIGARLYAVVDSGINSSSSKRARREYSKKEEKGSVRRRDGVKEMKEGGGSKRRIG
ncbi:MAG: H/ACA ribonucleoprotein complex subunit GAR1 [Candidatus Nitrosocaldus sp.]